MQAARKLVDGGASCIAGSWASSVTIPVSRSVTSREGVLQISPASTSDEITGLEDNNLLDRTVPPDSFQGPVLANVVADGLGGAEGKTVNIGARNDSYGNGLVDTFSGPWEDMGGKIGQTVIYDPTQPSYDSEARRSSGATLTRRCSSTSRRRSSRSVRRLRGPDGSDHHVRHGWPRLEQSAV